MHIMFLMNKERFQIEMLAQNKNVTELAKASGVTTVTIANLISGKRKATVKTCNKLAKALNVPVNELFTVE